MASAVLALFGVLTFRSFFPDKRRWWQFLLPVCLASAGWGLDFCVQTDLEKINALINAGIKAAEQKNPAAIDKIISADYRDSYHNTKQQLMAHCRQELSQPVVEKIKRLALQLKITPPTAITALTVLAKFEKESYVARSYKPSVLIKIRLYLRKQPDKKWLINRAELLQLDRQPINWRRAAFVPP